MYLIYLRDKNKKLYKDDTKKIFDVISNIPVELVQAVFACLKNGDSKILMNTYHLWTSKLKKIILLYS